MHAGPERVADAGDDDVVTFSGILDHDIARVLDNMHVVAGPAVGGVIAATAKQRVVAAETFDQVGVRRSFQRIVSRSSGDVRHGLLLSCRVHCARGARPRPFHAANVRQSAELRKGTSSRRRGPAIALSKPSGHHQVSEGRSLMRKLAPWALIAIPVLYYFALIVGAATYPGYSHVTNYASELGAAEAPYPAIFNVSIIAAGIAAIVAAIFLPSILREARAGRTWAILAAVALALWGVAMIMGGMFPMPDDRHGGFGLGLAGPLIPLFIWLSLNPVPGTRGMRFFLAAIVVASVVMLAIMFGVGGLVTRANVGLWQRLNTAASIPWFAVLGWWLTRRDLQSAVPA